MSIAKATKKAGWSAPQGKPTRPCYYEHMKECNKNHPKIVYNSEVCPLCNEMDLLAEVLDEKEDIDQQNIEDLYKEVRAVRREVNELKRYLGLKTEHKMPKWWPAWKRQTVVRVSAPVIDNQPITEARFLTENEATHDAQSSNPLYSPDQ